MRGRITIWTAIFLFLFSCGRNDRPLDSDHTLHYYQFSLPKEKKAFAILQEAFRRIYPQIQVKIHTLPTRSDDQHQFYLTHTDSSGSGRIDVFAVDVIWVAEFARAGLLMNVDKLFRESEWSEFFPSSVKAASYEGQRFAVPLFVDGGVLYSRKDLLSKYGFAAPPSTWRELVQMAKTILAGENDPRLRGFVWQGKQYEGLICDFLEFLPEGTKSLISTDHPYELNFNKVAVRKTLRFMKDLVYTYKVSPPSVFSMSEEESRQVFQSGHAIFMRNWPYAWRLARQAGSPVAGKIEVSSLPSWSSNQKGRSTLGGYLVGIHSRTPHPEAARAWARFLGGKFAQKVLWNHLGLTPARETVFPDLKPRGFPMDLLRKIMRSTVPRPVNPMYIPLSQSMQAYISGALAGVYQVDRAIQLVQSDSRRLLRILKE